MKASRFGLARAGLICFLAFLPNTAAARVHFRISFGTPFFHHYPGFYHSYYPHYRWHSGHYRWSGIGRYGYPYGFMPRHYYGRRPLCSSGVGIWIDSYYPIVISPPIVAEAPRVISTRQAVGKAVEYSRNPTSDTRTARMSEKLRQKRSELLRALKIGNKDNRLEAVRDLAGFTFDHDVKKALEDVLLSDPDPELRKEVAELFGKTTNGNVVAVLETAKAEDSSREVRQAAYRAMIMLKGY